MQENIQSKKTNTSHAYLRKTIILSSLAGTAGLEQPHDLVENDLIISRGSRVIFLSFLSNQTEEGMDLVKVWFISKYIVQRKHFSAEFKSQVMTINIVNSLKRKEWRFLDTHWKNQNDNDKFLSWFKTYKPITYYSCLVAEKM